MSGIASHQHHRRSIRLPGYDYTLPGAYFITLVTWGRECLFGEIVGEEMILNDFGTILADAWKWLPAQYPYVQIDAWCIMPNHFHGILMINDIHPCSGGVHSQPPLLGSRPATTQTIKTKPLGS